MSQISYNDTPTVYLVPTPIGNMGDITYRAVETLKEVEVVFCEDTRVTGQLLNYLDIKKKLISSHNFNEEKNISKLLDYLQNGKSVAITTDRGTPIISDPGYELALAAIENGYNVVSLPGATAFVPALTSSGLSPMPFLFVGFLNSKITKREKELDELKKLPYTLIFYESPHRIEETLKSINNVLGNRKVSISREITKKFEEIYRGNIDKIIPEVKDAKGEFVIVVEGCKEIQNYDDITIIDHVNKLIDEGLTSKEAIKQVAHLRGLQKNIVYQEYHRGD